MTNTNKDGIVEFIVGPAVRKDGAVWSDPIPASHYSVSERMKRAGIETPLFKSESGFVTSAGRFVDRRTAWTIAEAQGQIVRVFGGTKELFSECLWTDEPSTPPADPPAEGAIRWEPGDNAITAHEGVEVVLLRESVANGETHWLCRMAHPRKTGDHIPWSVWAGNLRRAPAPLPNGNGDEERFTEVGYGRASRDYVCTECGNRYYLFDQRRGIFAIRDAAWPDALTWRCSTCQTIKQVTDSIALRYARNGGEK